MTINVVDLVKIKALTVGTGAITLGGAVPGYRGAETLTNGQQYSYAIQQGAEFEIGKGTYLSGTSQLTRSPVASSNGGAALDLQPNAQVAFVLLSSDLAQIKQGAPGAPGPAGPAGNVAATLADLKAAPISNVTMLYDQSTFTWTEGDYSATDPGQIDLNVVFSDNELSSVGAWIRQPASKIALSSGNSLQYFVDLLLSAAGAAATGASDGNSVQDNLDRHKSKLDKIVYITDPAFGAVGDGTTDDTAAIKAALASGYHVFVPKTSAHYLVSQRLEFARAGQRVFGEGALSKIVQTGSGDNATVFFTQYEDCDLRDLLVTPGTTVSDSLDGWGIYAGNAHRLNVSGLRVKGMRRGGVALHDSNNCTIADNFFSDSVVAQDGSEAQAQMGYDIYLYGSSSYNLLTRNQCVSGCGAGIGCQNAEFGKSMYGNVIDGNVVRNHPCYGLMLYLSATGTGMPADRVDDHIIVNNIVTDISGSVATGATLFYGAGIYIQGSDNFICSNNRVIRTNTDQSKPRSGSDVPAAIAISGFGRGAVVGNVIDDCYFGIAVINGSFELPAGDGVVINANLIDGARNHGIYLGSANSANVTGNRLNSADGNATQGIFIVQGGTLQAGPFLLRDNFIRGFGNGIEANTIAAGTVSLVDIRNNHIRDHSGIGIFAKADQANIVGNSIVSSTGSGITIATATAKATVSDNIVDTAAGNALEDAGPATTVYNNKFIAGAVLGYPAPLGGSATPSLDGRRYVSNSNTTTVTGFTGGKEGQLVVLTAEASFTLQHNTNLILRGAVDRSMTAGQAISLVFSNTRWREV